MFCWRSKLQLSEQAGTDGADFHWRNQGRNLHIQLSKQLLNIIGFAEALARPVARTTCMGQTKHLTPCPYASPKVLVHSCCSVLCLSVRFNSLASEFWPCPRRMVCIIVCATWNTAIAYDKAGGGVPGRYVCNWVWTHAACTSRT